MTTPKTASPELVESQADKEETVNEAVRRVEAGASLYPVVDKDLTAPPGSCADGACYIVASPATGDWAGHEGEIAIAVGTNASNGWYFRIPEEGVFAWVQDETPPLHYWDNSSSPGSWQDYAAGVVGSLALNDLTDVDTTGVADGYIMVYEDSPAGYRLVPRRLGAPFFLQVACSDETTALEVGDALVTFRQIGGVVLDEVRASLNDPQADAQVVVDLNKNGSTILSTLIIIDQGATTSVGSSPQPVISDNVIPDNAEWSVDLVSVGGVSPITAAGLKVQLIGRYLAS